MTTRSHQPEDSQRTSRMRPTQRAVVCACGAAVLLVFACFGSEPDPDRTGSISSAADTPGIGSADQQPDNALRAGMTEGSGGTASGPPKIGVRTTPRQPYSGSHGVPSDDRWSYLHPVAISPAGTTDSDANTAWYTVTVTINFWHQITNGKDRIKDTERVYLLTADGNTTLAYFLAEDGGIKFDVLLKSDGSIAKVRGSATSRSVDAPKGINRLRLTDDRGHAFGDLKFVRTTVPNFPMFLD